MKNLLRSFVQRVTRTKTPGDANHVENVLTPPDWGGLIQTGLITNHTFFGSSNDSKVMTIFCNRNDSGVIVMKYTPEGNRITRIVTTDKEDKAQERAEKLYKAALVPLIQDCIDDPATEEYIEARPEMKFSTKEDLVEFLEWLKN
jgi:hypothetical protein